MKLKKLFHTSLTLSFISILTVACNFDTTKPEANETNNLSIQGSIQSQSALEKKSITKHNEKTKVFLNRKIGNRLTKIDSTFTSDTFLFDNLDTGTYSVSADLDGSYGAVIPEFPLHQDEQKDLGAIQLNVYVTLNIQVQTEYNNIYYNGNTLNGNNQESLSLTVPNQEGPQPLLLMKIQGSDTTWIHLSLQLINDQWVFVIDDNTQNPIIEISPASSSSIIFSSTEQSSSSLVVTSSSSNDLPSSSSSFEPSSNYLKTLPADSFINLAYQPTIHSQSLYVGDSYAITVHGEANYSNGSPVREIACLTSPDVPTRAQYDIIPLGDTLVVTPRYEWADCFVADWGNTSTGQLAIDIIKLGSTPQIIQSEVLNFPTDMIQLSNVPHIDLMNLSANSNIEISVTGHGYFDIYDLDPMNGVIFLHDTPQGRRLSVLETESSTVWENNGSMITGFVVDHNRYMQNPGEFQVEFSETSAEIMSSSSSIKESSSSSIQSILKTNLLSGDSFIDLSYQPTIHTQSLTIGHQFLITAYGEANYSDGSPVREIACLTSPDVPTRAQYDIIPLGDTLEITPRYEWGDCFVVDQDSNSNGSIFISIMEKTTEGISILKKDSLLFPYNMIVLNQAIAVPISDLNPEAPVSVSISDNAYFDIYYNDPMNGVIFSHNTPEGRRMSVVNTGESVIWNNSSTQMYAFIVDHNRYLQNPGQFKIDVTQSF